jgi:elongation factor Tu
MSSISRTANLLLRSSRASLLRPRAVNPIQHVFCKDKLAARGMATAFERTKPHVNIGMV